MRFILIFLAVGILLSCKKDKFTTKPQLKITSINSTDISGSQTLRITLTATDKEGDYSSYFAIKKTVAACPSSNYTDTSGKFNIPGGFIDTKEKEAEIIVTLSKTDRGANTCFASGGGVKADTAIFSFWIRDRAGNTSDTVQTKPIIIRN
ncbi:MAG: hypothetical protein JJE22_06365 [Bacteroidia bacterium]|nr:hypothetical protein [Bacteroidia bacterium]